VGANRLKTAFKEPYRRPAPSEPIPASSRMVTNLVTISGRPNHTATTGRHTVDARRLKIPATNFAAKRTETRHCEKRQCSCGSCVISAAHRHAAVRIETENQPTPEPTPANQLISQPGPIEEQRNTKVIPATAPNCASRLASIERLPSESSGTRIQ
jgi:hypothetical protein